MKEEIVPCKKCGGMPRIVKIDTLYYAQCTGKVKTKIRNPHTKEVREITVVCPKWSPYDHLGLTERGAIQVWNAANTRNGGINETDF